MKYKIKLQDLEKCFKFAVEYHLDDKKTSSNRTTGQYRGLGSIIDSFIIGKLIEIGVAKIIDEFSEDKEIGLDFDIHSLTKENLSDPDITKIKENGAERKPKIFVEIKNLSSDDRWIGLTSEQFNTIMRSEIPKNNLKKIFIIYASLISQDQKLDSDLLGEYLKENMDLDILKKFCSSEDLYIEIKHILTGEDLKKFGIPFNEGSYMYETEVFRELNEKTSKKICEENSKCVKKKIDKSILPIIMRDNYPISKEIGKFEYNGDLDFFVKENEKSKRSYVFCKTDVIVKNKILGVFNLKKGKFYECFFTTVGRNPVLKRNNIWIAQRNINNLGLPSPEKSIKNIEEEI